MSLEKIAETTFTARVVREYSGHPTVDDLGVHENKATLYKFDEGHFSVDWEAGPEEFASIGLLVEGQKIVDYDGVFFIPREIMAFLKAQGFDTSDVEV